MVKGESVSSLVRSTDEAWENPEFEISEVVGKGQE